MSCLITFVLVFFCFIDIIDQGQTQQSELSHLNISGNVTIPDQNLSLTGRKTSPSSNEHGGLSYTSSVGTLIDMTDQNVVDKDKDKGRSTQSVLKTPNTIVTNWLHSSKGDSTMTQQTRSSRQTDSSTKVNWLVKNTPVSDESTKATPLHRDSNGRLSSLSTSVQPTDSQEKSETTTMKPDLVSTGMTTVAGNVVEDNCLQDTKCKPNDLSHWYCGCDVLCLDYNDCCYQTNVTDKTRRHHRYNCTGLMRGSNKKEVNQYVGIYTISNCMVKNSSLIEKCENDDIIDGGPPVVSKKDKRLIYKNKHCAFCNNENEFTSFGIIFSTTGREISEIIMNDIKTNFSSNQDMMQFLVESGCSYEYVPPKDANVRRCMSSLWENDNLLCQMYINPILKGSTFYRNIYCSNPENDELSYHTCQAEFYERLVFIKSVLFRKLSVIFAFTEKESTLDHSDASSCESWTQEIADQGLCSHKISITQAVLQIRYYARAIVDNITDYDLERMVVLTLWAKSLPIKERVEGRSNIERYETVLKISSKMKISKRSFLDEIERFEHDFSTQMINIIVKDRNIDRPIFTTEVNSSQPDQDFVHVKDHKYAFDIVYLAQIYKIIIPQKAPIINQNCTTLTLALKRREDEFIHVDSVVCNQSSEEPKNVSSNILAILTYIFCGISIISLGILIAYNRKNNLYVDIPSSNLENIAVSILTANLVFLCGIGATKLQKLCYAISIALHYFWLASFSFTSLAVVYIVSTLLKMRARQNVNSEDQSKQRKVLTMLGMLIPILLVGPAVVIDQHGPEYLSPGYGQSACFPTQYPGNLIFFTGPVMASVSMNLVCLIPVIVKLQKTAMETRQIRQSSVYDQGKIYLRLIVLSGILWMTGIFAAIFRLEWLDYVFTIVCGLHGFFLAVANLTTTRIKRLRNKTNDDSPP